MKRLIPLLVVVSLLLSSSPASAGYGRAVLLFNLQDQAIAESSGVASYSRSNDVLFTHNDSGDFSRFFAIGPKGQTLATYNVVGAGFVDWEDMARGPGSDGNPALYFADMGDNIVSEEDAVRPFVTVYGVAEPEVDRSATGASSAVPVSSVTHLVYEDGPHNAETMFVHPRTGQVGIVTKVTDGESGVYLAEPALNLSATGPLGVRVQILQRVASISFRKIARPFKKTDFGPESRLLTSGGAISPDGKRFVVRSYVEAFEWDISRGLASGLKRKPMRIPLPRTKQGEAITYARNGRSLVTTSEQLPAPVHLIPAA